jgi:phage-related holin
MPSASIKPDFQKEMEQAITTLKLVFTVTMAATVQWVLPLKSFIGAMLLLVLADLITGVHAASKRGEVVHSRGFRRTVVKFTMYCVAIVTAHAMETVFFPAFPMVFAIAAYIAATEFWSVLENVGTVTGTNVLEAVRKYLGNFLKK